MRGQSDERAGTNGRQSVLEALRLEVAIAVVALALHLTGIGCPIKFATGVSCPGCGMTRAWLAALGGHLGLALAYHPLFWTVPLVLALVCARPYLPRVCYQVASVTLVLTFIIVWVARLGAPHVSNVLFSGVLTEDVVSIDVPVWLSYLLALVG